MKTRMKQWVCGWGVVLASMSGLAAPAVAAEAPGATLYEIVENMTFAVEFDSVPSPKPLLIYRVSNWTAQGTAVAGSPFCGPNLTDGCTITAFGFDKFLVQRCTVDFATCEFAIGSGGAEDRVWANVAAVANDDNFVDGPEGIAFTGQITGKITIFPLVVPDLNKNKKALGPALPLLYVTEGKYFPDLPTSPTIRTSPPSDLPSGTADATFNATFRLPFTVGKDGVPATPERGKNAFYLDDDGSLIKVHPKDEFALGFPLLRAEVTFD